MGNVQINGTLIDAPRDACDAPAFPSGSTSVPFGLLGAPCPKGAPVSTGAMRINVNSPSAFVALPGVGGAGPVTKADTVYVRAKAGGFQLRVTFNNPAGSPIVSVIPLAGLFILEPDAAGSFYAELLEIQGSGTVEYLASGQS